MLTNYGIYDFTLLKARYIFVGSIFLLLSFMALICAFGVLKSTERIDSILGKIVAGFLLAVFTSMIIGTSVKGFLTFVTEGRVALATVATYIRIWAFIAVIIFTIMILIIKGGLWTSQGIPMPVPWSVFIGAIIISVIYALSVYPFIPISMGGGIPIPVQFIVNKDQIEIAEQFIKLENDLTTETMYLLDQSTTAYFLLIIVDPDNLTMKPVEINKSLFVGIVHPDNVAVPIIITPTPMPSTTTPIPTQTPVPTP